MRGADPAWDALPARFVLEETQYLQQKINRARAFIAYKHNARTQRNALFKGLVNIQRKVKQVFAQDTARGTADLREFEFLPAGHPLPVYIDNLAKRGAHRHFDKPRTVHLP